MREIKPHTCQFYLCSYLIVYSKVFSLDYGGKEGVTIMSRHEQVEEVLDSSSKGMELKILSKCTDTTCSDDDLVRSGNISNLRRVTGSIPVVCYSLCFIEFSERLSYYLIQGCITNMIQRGLPHNSTTGAVVEDAAHSNESPGALGLGLPLATFLLQLMTWTANISPLISGYYADTKLGRFNAIVIGTVVGIFGHVLLLVAAFPVVLRIVPLSLILTVISLLVVAVSAGFIKPNLMPLLMDQYSAQTDYVKILPSGEQVLVERKATLEKMTLIYYLFINIGCFLAFIGSFIERKYGFWAVYLLTAVVYMVLPILLLFLKPKLRIISPSGSSIFDSIFPLLRICFSRGWFSRLLHGEFWSYSQLQTSSSSSSNRLSITMDDLHSTFQNCAIFLYFIVFNVNDSALTPLQINQSGSMTTNGMPNDFFQSFNPLAIILMIPIQDCVIYPILRRKRIVFTSVDKITLGFVLAGLGSMYGALLQHRIYLTSKCGDHASTCPTVAPVSAWWCSIMFSLQAIGECFSTVTCYELAYSHSPKAMQSFVVAIFLTSMSFSSIIGEIISCWSYDPNLVKIFGWCGMMGVIFALIFFVHFHRLRAEEFCEKSTGSTLIS